MNEEINFSTAILSLKPGSSWVMYGNDLETLEWKDDVQKKPTKKQIIAEYDRLVKEQETYKYKKLRSSEYPSIGDQLDALFKAGVFPEEMTAQIQAVKDKYPKV